MNVNGEPYRSIWLNEDGSSVDIIDQTRLPHEFEIVRMTGLEDAAKAIEIMQVRGAPLIGATAAYGICLALNEDASDAGFDRALERLGRTRPTAVNLNWALEIMEKNLREKSENERVSTAYDLAALICDEDVETNRAIGDYGHALIEALAVEKGGEPVNILTHCNAGWLATVDWGTALSPIYKAHNADIPVHVWADETRPRNQGASLTAWELGQHGVPHTIIADNAGGHMMQHGKVDMVITGTDRTARNGDVANKIGTYLKALAAHDNGIPFYVCLPFSTVDWDAEDGFRDIPIEERAQSEVTHMRGRAEDGTIQNIQISSPGSDAANPAFDVTPARLVTGLITERGVCAASETGLHTLYPERAESSDGS
ncbi:MAG: S-methyl-5-thioribose-1-phosphate isomerase [Hyphomicrobiales bacterium]